MECERCGFDLPIGTHKFCPDCGFKFSAPVTVAPVVQPPLIPKPAIETPARPNGHLSFVQSLVVIIFASGGLWFYFGGGLEKQAAVEMRRIENQVAEDAVKQYEIAKRQGNKIQIAVQAGLVSAAYLQANDEVNYRKWKAIEEEANKSAGLNLP